MISAVKKWKAYRRLNPPIRLEGNYTGTPPPEELDIAERFLISGAQKDFKKGELDSLQPETVLTKGHNNNDVPIILVGGRAKVRYRIGYNRDRIPVLPCKNQLSRIYMTEAHKTDHRGINTTLMRSRYHVWVIQGAKLAKKVVQ